jgi:PAS domain S-box-containing protein
MFPNLLPLFIAPAILLPLAAYALVHRRVRGAVWYATLLLALSIWCAAYAWELSATTFAIKVLALKVKYIGVVLLPMAWLGFIYDLVAADEDDARLVVRTVGTASCVLLLVAWTDGWHGWFWGGLTLEGAGSGSVLVGRGPGFWLNVALTYGALVTGVLVLAAQAVASPYLYRKRAAIIIAAAVVPWGGNLVFVAGDEHPGTVDLTPVLFAVTAILAALAVFRYRVLDPIPTLRDVRIEVIGDGLIIVDARGRVADLNRAAEGILARSRAAAAGLDLEQVLAGVGPLDGGPERVDVRRQVAGSERTFDASVTPITTPTGQRTGWLVLLRDVTERRQLEEQLRQAQKMEAVGKLAGGVAHDFNNLLTAIIGFTALALDDVPEGSPASHALAQVRRSAEQAADLTRQLLAFGRRQILQPEPLDLSEVVRQMEPMLRRLLGADIAIRCEYAEHLPVVMADLIQVQQMLLNLVVNARDAMPAGGALTIVTGRLTVDRRVDGGPDVPPGDYVSLDVSDTGEGIAPRDLERIFEPFFTTKEFGRGAGLGLSTVYGIAKQSGGDVFVRSLPGAGTAFTVLLPASAELRPGGSHVP